MYKNTTERLRDKVLIGMCLTLGPAALILGIMNILLWDQKAMYLGFLEIAYSILSLYMVIYIRKNTRPNWFLDVQVVILMFLTVIWSFLNVEKGSSLFLWSLSLPIIFYLALGKTKGSILSIITFTIMLLTIKEIVTYDYLIKGYLYLNFITSFICTWGVSYAYEVNRERGVKELELLNSSLSVRSSNLRTSLEKTELELLRMQTNPHFLFNTLNLISSEIPSRPDLAQTILFDLSDLLRGTVDISQKNQIPISREIELVKYYLAIQSTRFENRLNYEININNNSETVNIPPMLIIPLVENIIKHVVSKSNTMTKIGISISHSNSTLLIEVDNTNQASDNISFKPSGGHSNINRTLALQYGIASFRMQNTKNITSAKISINLDTYKETTQC